MTGAGPIGIMAAAVARRAGARRVVISDPNAYRRGLAAKVGVTLAVDPTATRLAEVQKTLGMQEGFDVGLEMSGNPAAFREMLGNMSHGAKIAMLEDSDEGDGDRLESCDLQPTDAAGHIRSARCMRPGTR